MPEYSHHSCSHACGLTDVGRRRQENQDQFLIAELRKAILIDATSLPLPFGSPILGDARGHLLVVADGMGGHAAGKKASSLALDQLIQQLLNQMHWFLHIDLDCENDFLDSLKNLLQQAHAHILSEAANDRSQRGMGTTLTMAYIVWPRMYILHAGDSRCYLIRDGQCDQLTTDHTLARQLVEAGGLKPEEEAQSRWSNVLWNVVGGSGDQDLIAEVRRVDLIEGDHVLLCSDGLTRYISPQILTDIVARADDDLSSVCQQMIDLANEAGGEDNVTVVVCRPDGALSGTSHETRVPPNPEATQSDETEHETDCETDLKPKTDHVDVPPHHYVDEDTLPEA